MHEIPKDRNNIDSSPPVPKAVYEMSYGREGLRFLRKRKVAFDLQTL